ncbi:MAG: TIGR04283 family arsenosugar biosynthesis glycosyltransferase [Proteobacteria bacterium]|nr:TIGR04283 family arsenosugar biosynthesis glycosyltransferase [Pseudomonadota bacterium]MBU1389340.1 TIGR04283 family arsenosugar biosynthesis glycosyltransferase [Pseudomonadota bacterium]MBU1544160.1 TIGR04283 family arsenosugar biosynthesis glycosyltransferase [Pseudomonadota bacterium]MBU2429369.1 TIGR04283 family arsenosugar biosynthesis glycosyltransferase [Pseudomonadota bacterium]MBU2480165.1 TIGR04283 family arsenosugar biosynthesis glycosyltransferase [Pseudomonadota bacterium]
MSMDISVIIPVLNEERNINRAIDAVFAQKFYGSIEIIVVDGHADATTLGRIKNKKVIQLNASAGRGTQMNAGAGAASGKVLLFLHCDTVLPMGALTAIHKTMAQSTIKAGAFDLSIDSPGRLFRMIEKSASLRSRITRIPYGDQAIFIEKNFFFKVGQYSPIPIMEDVDLMRKLKKNKGRIQILDLPVITSARRWKKEGLLYCTLRNWTLLTFFFLGVKPQTLVKLYKS